MRDAMDGFFFQWLKGTMGALTSLLGHFVVFPIDALFFCCDSFLVPLRKTGVFEHDCRGPFRGGREGPCGPAAKYTNKWLFRLVCRDACRQEEAPWPVCGARRGIRLYLLRIVVVWSALAMALVAGIIIGVQLLPEERAEQKTAGGAAWYGSPPETQGRAGVFRRAIPGGVGLSARGVEGRTAK